MSKEIQLTRGKVAIVDDEDFEYLNQWKWQAEPYSQTYRASRTQKTGFTKKKKIYMHRVIMNCPDNMVVDHKNHIALDNRKDNLRIATREQNSKNIMSTKSRSGFKGVVKQGNKYRARIGVNNRKLYLGLFDTPEDAAKAYDIKAIEVFGEFAFLNFK